MELKIANPAASMMQGMQYGAQIQDMRNQNALRQLYQQQGAEIAAGDEGALNALAQYDPQAAMQIRRQNRADQRADQRFALDQQRFDMETQRFNQQTEMNAVQLEQMRERGRREAEIYARELTAAERAAEAAEIDGALASAAASWRQGPEAFQAWTQQNAEMIAGAGLDPSALTYEAFPTVAAGLKGASDGFKAGLEALDALQPPQVDPMSPAGKLAADLERGLITPEQYNAATQKSGMRVSVDADGQVTFEQGVGVTGGAKLTEGQSKDNVYATRAKGALDVLEPVADTLTNRVEGMLGAVPLGIGREGQSQEYQVAQQAGQEFLQAILRKDTGAAITSEEQQLYGETFLPQPGDGPAVLEAKRASRSRAIEAIQAGMMPLQILQTERALLNADERTRQAREANGTLEPGTVEDGYTYLGGDPADPKSWRKE